MAWSVSQTRQGQHIADTTLRGTTHDAHTHLPLTVICPWHTICLAADIVGARPSLKTMLSSRISNSCSNISPVDPFILLCQANATVRPVSNICNSRRGDSILQLHCMYFLVAAATSALIVFSRVFRYLVCYTTSHVDMCSASLHCKQA